MVDFLFVKPDGQASSPLSLFLVHISSYPRMIYMFYPKCKILYPLDLPKMIHRIQHSTPLLGIDPCSWRCLPMPRWKAPSPPVGISSTIAAAAFEPLLTSTRNLVIELAVSFSTKPP
jgi:hypothetical protein